MKHLPENFHRGQKIIDDSNRKDSRFIPGFAKLRASSATGFTFSFQKAESQISRFPNFSVVCK